MNSGAFGEEVGAAKKLSLLVWDGEDSPPKGDWDTLLWRSFGADDAPDAISIPKLVESQAVTLRGRYLAWLYELGEAKIDGKRLVDHLSLRPGFSYWWMTLLAEKSYGKSPRLVDAVKLWVLEELIDTSSADQLILASGDNTLAQAVSSLCKNAGIEFEWSRLDKVPNRQSFARRFFRMLPHPLQALAFLLRYLIQRWALRQLETPSPEKFAGKITFCSYFDNLEMLPARQGAFSSRYWTDLTKVLTHGGICTNWCQLFVKDDAVMTTQQALDLTADFNRTGAGQQVHFTLDAALSLRVIVRVLRDYASIVLAGLFLRKARGYFRPSGSKVDFWPLCEEDWSNSLFGATAVSNCLFLNLFERALGSLPPQKLGVYLLENQAWERAFIYAWRAAGHTNLVGSQHTTVTHWDLRHFFDPRNYRHTGMNDLPLPDSVALNGPAAIAAYRQGGFPEERVVEVEALRYLYLANLSSIQGKPKVGSKRPLSVLVLGDYLQSVTRHQMKWLVAAASLLPADTRYIVKPHPNCLVKNADYPSLRMLITSAPLVELFGDCDVAYTSNITSAAVDAYCADIPVVSVLNADAFNMSPLRGLVGVQFVTSAEELADSLRSPSRLDCESEREGYFTIDRALPRWRSLLDSAGVV